MKMPLLRIMRAASLFSSFGASKTYGVDPAAKSAVPVVILTNWYLKKLSGWWLSPTPLKNMSSLVGMMTFPIYGNIFLKKCSKPPTSCWLKPNVPSGTISFGQTMPTLSTAFWLHASVSIWARSLPWKWQNTNQTTLHQRWLFGGLN